ncbi:MAG: hypothetical protein ACI89L_002859, partial [Phycisphaerales bacterium]
SLRFAEDWSAFEASGTGDYWDAIKHIDLSDDGEFWLGMGGELRYRTETWSGFGFAAADTADDTFGLARGLLYTDWHLGNVRVFIEGESAFATDRDLPGGRRGLDVDELDLHNAFVEFDVLTDADRTLGVRLGRQSLLFGKQRLVSHLPWANSQRSWDGARFMLETGGWKVDAFYTRNNPVKKHDFNDWQAGSDFWGVYATGKLGKDKSVGLDLYYLGLNKEGPVTINGSTGEESRYTVGSRVFGKFGDSGFDYDAEAAYQIGEVGSADVSAYMLAAQLGYTVSDTGWKPRVYVGVDLASGDDSAGDGDVETFNQLFPLGHAYFGSMDFIGRQNITDLSLGFSIKPHDRVTIKGQVHHFMRTSDGDSVYNAGGGVLRATSPGASDQVGQELDLKVGYAVDRHLSLEAGYAHFFAGDYLSDTGSDEDVDFYYLQAMYRF